MVWVKPPMPKTFEKSYINVNSMNWLIAPVTDFVRGYFANQSLYHCCFKAMPSLLERKIAKDERRESEG